MDNLIRVHNEGHVHLEDSMGSDLHIVNNARVSFDQESGELTERERGLMNFLMRERHGSPWEAVVFRFDVKAPLFVIREWQRHRMGCLTGDTRVSFVDTNGSAPRSLSKTIDELWEMWTIGERNGLSLGADKVEAVRQLADTGISNREIARRIGISHTSVANIVRGEHRSRRDSRWRVRRMKLRVCNEATGEFTTGHIEDIVDKGVQAVYRVTTEDGSDITMTETHRVLTPNGWLTLAELAGISDGFAALSRPAYLMRNGELAYRNRDWLAARRAEGMSVAEMAAAAGCSYHTIRKWLRIQNLQFDQAERNFQPGHRPWNDGVKGYRLPAGRLSEQGRSAIRAARGGSRSNFWRGGVSSERANIARWTREQAPRVHARYNWECQACAERGGSLHAHHIVPVWADPQLARSFDNLITMCDRCHRAIHRSVAAEKLVATTFARAELPPPPEAVVRSKKLVAHPTRIVAVEHVGYRQTYDLCVAGPHHNFVANGLVVHNSFNEQSARYSEIPDHYYVPAREYVREQKGKPGSYYFDTIEDPELVEATIRTLEHTQRSCFDAYHQMLERGVAKELARTVLPVGMFSRMKWTVNLRALFNFLSLRNHEHAQREIRDYAVAVEELAKEVVPVAFECFEQHGRVTP